MKNIHLIPTEKPSRIVKNTNNQIKLTIQTLPKDLELGCYPQYIYITSDKEVKEGGWHFNLALNLVEKTTSFHNGLLCEKIILTTDQDLIADGVQAIDDEFLEWIVKNPSCQYGGYKDIDWGKIITSKEEPKQERVCNCGLKESEHNVRHPFIPREEPKQEKLEETTEINLTRLCYYDKRNPDFQIKEEYGYDKEEVEATGNFSKKDCACDNCFYGRSKLTEQLIWQQERMYTEEEVGELVYKIMGEYANKKNIFFKGDLINNLFEQFKKK
jgi:hypothetical protein